MHVQPCEDKCSRALDEHSSTVCPRINKAFTFCLSIKKEEEERKQLPDVMTTLGEWGQDEREREPTKFEQENPNILMLDGTGDFKNM